MARRREDLATVHLHQHPAIWLPVVDGPYPEYDTLQSLEACGIGERGAPLTGPCLCRDPGTSFLRRIVCLREGCVELMGPCWRKILSFVIDPCGGPEEAFEASCTVERSRPTGLTIEILNRSRDGYPSLS